MLRFWLFIIFFSVFSCASKESKSPEFFTGNLMEYSVDTFLLEKDTRTKNLPSVFTYFQKEEEEFLYAFTDFRLLKYSYPKGELLNVQPFEKEGPDGIGTWIAGHLITAEGIFFISDNKQLIRTDLEGRVVDRMELPEVGEDRLAANFNTMNGNAMAWIPADKKLIVLDVPFVLKAPNIVYQDWVWTFDLETKSSSVVPFRYPELYREFLDDPELGVYSHHFFEGKHLISFPASDSLLVIEKGNQFWVEAKSSQNLKFEKGRMEHSGEYTAFLPNMDSSRYKWILSDPSQKILLRYLIVGTEERGEGKYNKCSFIVFDEQLQKRGELFFTSEQVTGQGFATPQGLYLKLQKNLSDDYEGFVRVNFEAINPS